MRPPGFLGACRIVAAKDLRLEWRTWETLSASLVFSLIVLVVFSFAFGSGAVRELGSDRLVPGVLWTVLAFASVVGLTRSFQLERPGNTLAAMFAAPVDAGALFVGKLAANLVQLTLLAALLVPLTALFFDVDLTRAAPALAAVLLLHGLGLAILGTLFAAVASRVNRGEALLATLLFPAASPVLISAVTCTAGVLAGRPLAANSRWLIVTAGFDVLYLLVALLTFEFLLEE